jgi:hypothetical protein
MATDNPGFTERADIFYSNSTSVHLGVAVSAARASTNATGNFTLSQGNETHSTIGIGFLPAPVGPANLKTFNGLAKADIKTIEGLAIGSVKTVNGLS